MCEVWQTSNLRRLRLGEEKRRKKKKKKKPQDENIMVCPIPYVHHKNITYETPIYLHEGAAGARNVLESAGFD